MSWMEIHTLTRLSQRWCELGLPQTPLGGPLPERQVALVG